MKRTIFFLSSLLKSEVKARKGITFRRLAFSAVAAMVRSKTKRSTAAAATQSVRRSRRLSVLAAGNPFSLHTFGSSGVSVSATTGVGVAPTKGRKRRASVKSEEGKRSRQKLARGRAEMSTAASGKGGRGSDSGQAKARAKARTKAKAKASGRNQVQATGKSKGKSKGKGKGKGKGKVVVKRRAPKDWKKVYEMIGEVSKLSLWLLWLRERAHRLTPLWGRRAACRPNGACRHSRCGGAGRAWNHSSQQGVPDADRSHAEQPDQRPGCWSLYEASTGAWLFAGAV